MKRIVSLVLVAMIMSALVFASALPAFAAPPTFVANCTYADYGIGRLTSNPQGYKAINAFYRNCQDSGGAASREITPARAHPSSKAEMSPEIDG